MTDTCRRCKSTDVIRKHLAMDFTDNIYLVHCNTCGVNLLIDYAYERLFKGGLRLND